MIRLYFLVLIFVFSFNNYCQDKDLNETLDNKSNESSQIDENTQIQDIDENSKENKKDENDIKSQQPEQSNQDTLTEDDIRGKVKHSKNDFVGDFMFIVPMGSSLNVNYTKNFKSRLDPSVLSGIEFQMDLRFLKARQLAFWFLIGYTFDNFFYKEEDIGSYQYQRHDLSLGVGVDYFVGDFFFGLGFYSKVIFRGKNFNEDIQKDKKFYTLMSDYKGFEYGGQLRLGYHIKLTNELSHNLDMFMPIFLSISFLSFEQKVFSTPISLNFGLSFRYSKKGI